MEIEWKIAYLYIIYGIIMLIAYMLTKIYYLAIISEFIFIFIYFYHSLKYKGKIYTVKFFLISYFISFIIEIIGVNTGIPFGNYYYTDILGEKFLGVPLAIPFLWSSLLYFTSIAGNFNIYKSSALMLFLDLSFDPRFSMHLWHWVNKGIYFGVPLTNFFGWFISSLIIFLILNKALKFNKNYDLNGVIFYFLLGIFQGIEDYTVALYYLSYISFAMFIIIFYFMYKNYINNKNFNNK